MRKKQVKIKQLASRAMAVFFAISIITIGFSNIATPQAFASQNHKPVITLDSHSWTIANFVIGDGHHVSESLARSGLTASDAEDGPIDSNQIQVSGLGSIDENTPGTYFLTMTVTDLNGSTSDPFVREINYRATTTDRTPGRCYENDDYSDIYTIECEAPAICGDGYLAGNEECDDGNNDDGDGCSSTCMIEQSPVYQCNDCSDNDNDGLIDEQDPGCHSDNNPNNSSSYTPNKDSEFNTSACAFQPTSILKLAYLDSIKVYEKTGVVNTYTFSPFDDALKNDINESATEYDFTDSTSGEYYDIFISDEQGDLDLDGGYITIDCYRDSNSQNTAVANNIDAVKVELSNSTSIYADVVSKTELGTGLSGEYADSQGYAQNAVGAEDDNITYLGNQYSSITLGFCQQLPENQKPIITVLGDNPLDLKVGDTFTDPGATANDAEDGDITGNIVKTGNVDTSTPGSYTIAYNVQDSQGLSADQKTRVVNVDSNSNPPNPGPPGPAPAPSYDEELTISNEKAQCETNGEAIITWDTNLSATSQVVYGKIPTSMLGSADDNYGYSSSTDKNSDLVKQHSITVSGIQPGIAYYFRPVSEDEDSNAKVGIQVSCSYEEKQTPVVPVCGNNVLEQGEQCDDGNLVNGDGCSNSCEIEKQEPQVCNYLLEYLKIGKQNNPVEVRKLQSFLKTFEGFSNLEVTGTFDQPTFDAVSAFQEKYRKDVLDPWGMKDPSGYVYITTKKKINEIYCSREFPLTNEQISEINKYKNLLSEIQKQKEQGIDTKEQESKLPIIGVAPNTSEKQENGKELAGNKEETTESGISLKLNEKGEIKQEQTNNATSAVVANATSSANKSAFLAVAGSANLTSSQIPYLALLLLVLLILTAVLILIWRERVNSTSKASAPNVAPFVETPIQDTPSQEAIPNM